MSAELLDTALGQLGRASLAGAAAAAALWWLGRRGLAPAAHAWLWWAVSLKFLLVLVVPPVTLPWLPAASPDRAGVAVHAAAPFATPPPGERLATGPPPARPAPAPWKPAAAGLWLAGVLAGLAVSGRRWLAVRRLVAASRPATDPALGELFHRLRRERGLGRVELRLARGLETPLVVGLWRPAILLPAGRAALAPDETRLLLEHELTHLERNDLWWSLVPALTEKLFFFHPAARLAAREYDIHREAACDARVLARRDASPRAYGRLLLKLCRPAPARLTAAAAARRQTLERRLQMLARPVATPSPGRVALLVLAAAVLLAPVRLTARPAVAPEPAPATAASAVGPTPAVAPIPATPAPAPAAERHDEPEPPATHGGNGFGYVLLRDGQSWVHGASHHVDRARAARRGGEDLLWAWHDGRTWVIRDRALLDRVDEIFNPQRELGARQGELGEQQGELGGRQAELGARQAELGREQAALAGRQVEVTSRHLELTARLMRLQHARESPDEQTELRAAIAELDEARRELGTLQGELGRRQGELGRLQGELGARQGELGARQGELGERQGELARRISRQLEELVGAAVAEGLAEPVD